MAENPITIPLPADLPEDWTSGQTVSPTGSEAGLTEQHGYNYLMEQVNRAQEALKEVGEAFRHLAGLDEGGKLPAELLPPMNYDPAGSAAAVQGSLNHHINDKNNPHKVTAAQVGAASTNIVNTGWKLLWSKETAGSENWVAPDLFDGKSYKIGVLVIGGGGSGAAAKSGSPGLTGGASGRSLCFTMVVSPGESFPVVVGKGGEGIKVNYSTNASGQSGGSSSFNNKVASGGSGGNRDLLSLQSGAQPSIIYPSSVRPFGGAIYPNIMHGSINAYYCFGVPMECFNPFENKIILGAGGAINNNSALSGGTDPVTGLGGSSGVYRTVGTSISGDASAPGCGSGAAYTSNKDNNADGYAQSGNGANGAVYVYIQGVAQ